MTVKELIVRLKQLDPKTVVKVASDEEWNTIFSKADISLAEEKGLNSVVFWGYSGSEEY